MSLYLTLPLVEFAFNIVLMIVVLSNGRYRNNIHRVFSCFLLTMAFWGLYVYLMRSSPDVQRAVFWEKVGVLPAITFTSVFFYHFARLYSGLKLKQWTLYAAYAFAVFVLVMSPLGFFVSQMQVKSYGYAPVTGIKFLVFYLGSAALAIFGIVNLVRAYHASNEYETKNRFIYLITGALLSIVGGTFDILPTFGLPLYPGAIFGNLIFAGLNAVALTRYHLLDIQLVIRKSVAYFLVSAPIALLYVGVILGFERLVGNKLSVWGFLIVLGLALALQPLWRRMQNLVDKMFYRDRYDFLKALEEFTQEAHAIVNLEQLGSSLVRLMSRAFQASSVHVLLPTTPGTFSIVASSNETGTGFKLEDPSPLLSYLHSTSGIIIRQDLDIIPQLQSFTEKEKAELRDMRAELFVPMKLKDGELAGLFIMGQKLSQQPYTREDQNGILTVATRMAVELENARLYGAERSMRKELQRQDEQKTEFLHSVAHELKTPLTAIISSSELLDSDLAGAAEQKDRLLHNITESAWSMDRRISELLDFARMESGEMHLQLKPLDIGPAIEEVSSRVSILFTNKNQTINLDIPAHLPPVSADRDKLEQILINMLSNANKYSPSEGHIVVRVRQRNDAVLVEVDDSAPIIPEEDRARIFEPYYRGEDTEKRNRMPGLGLGLTISRRLVRLHGGEMSFRTEPGRGNTFFFTIPLSREGDDNNGKSGGITK